MIRVEGWMEVQDLHQRGMNVSEISRELGLDRKTVRKHLQGPPQHYERKARASKIDAYRAWLRERWTAGVHNARKLHDEIRKQGYAGGYTRVRDVLQPWREEERQHAYVRFETEPGEQCQFDWGQVAMWKGHRLYCFVATLGGSRMRYVEFRQRQDVETLLTCLMHALRYFGGVPRVMLTDNMKTVVVSRQGHEIRWNARFIDFAAHYGFVPRACQPRRPETKGKVESAIRFVKGNFWPGIQFNSLVELNAQGLEWLSEVNARSHGTTGEIPLARWPREQLSPLDGHRDYDTGYVADRWVHKDCTFAYRGNRYSVPHRWANKKVMVRQAVDGDLISVYAAGERIAQHRIESGSNQMVLAAEHYAGLHRNQNTTISSTSAITLPAGPGLGLHYTVPQVEVRPLSEYEEVGCVAI